MSYYDNVKDNVKDTKTNSAGAPSFDTLKEAAEETSVDDEESDDGTPIEVLEEGGLKQENTSTKQTSQRDSSSESSGTQSKTSTPINNGQSADLSSIEQKLDKMIEQNQKIIEVLESFGQ